MLALLARFSFRTFLKHGKLPAFDLANRREYIGCMCDVCDG